jgi:glutathione synthase/RimK-type ligase-like ATP-grasp enzyme
MTSTLNLLKQKNFIGLVELMRLAHAGVDLAPLGQFLIDKTTENIEDADAFMDLSLVLFLRGYRELALTVQAEAIQLKRAYNLENTQAPTLKMLVLVGMGDLMANTPIEFLLENSAIALTLFYVTDDFFSPDQHFSEVLPVHDVLFVAVAESEENLGLLKTLSMVLTNWPTPVLNRPECIAKMARDTVYQLLENRQGIAIPQTQRYSLSSLKNQVDSLLYPLIIRPVDSHAGHELEKIDNTEMLMLYLSEQRHLEFFIAPFVDYRNDDGLFRKYRIVLCQGVPFVCHLAISAHWMIHYLNAGMADDAQKRAEEAELMRKFDQTFARKHAEAFEYIYQKTGLDYVGIDCSETPDGDLLIFEVDSCMIVHAIDPIDLFAYKPVYMAKLFKAFEKMVLSCQG